MTSRARVDELHRIDELLPQLGIALGCGPRRAAGEQSALQLHSFSEINPIVVRAELDSVLELFRLQAQKRKAESAAELTTRLRALCATAGVNSDALLLFLLSTSQRPTDGILSRDDTARVLQLTAPPPPLQDAQPRAGAPSSDSSDGHAYDAAWDESEPSDWEGDDSATGSSKATRRSAPLQPFAPRTPDPEPEAGVSSMGTITQETPAPLAHPNLPLPLMCGGAAEDANDFTCGNLVDSLEQQRNPLAVTDDTSRFSDAVVAQQCLQLMLDCHHETVFEVTRTCQSSQQCLRACTPRSCAALRPGTHLRDVSHEALRSIVAPFESAAVQRAALILWVHAVLHTAGRGSPNCVLPSEFMMRERINPSMAALVVAVSQQLDIVDAAIQDLQNWQQEQLSERAYNEPLLLWTRSLSRPVMNRLAFLHSAFAGAVAAALKTSRPPLQPGRTQQACAQLHAKVTRALVDQLHAATLRTEKLPARRGAVLQAILLHLLSSVIEPTLDAFEALCTEGALPGSHEHLCVGCNGNVHPRAPQFWQAACWRVQSQGQPVAPNLLASVVEQVVAAGKSVALLRAHRSEDRAVTQGSDAGSAHGRLMSRAIMELTDALLVHEAEAAPHWQQPHKLAGLLQQAEQVLSDMRREHDSAADALVSIAVALDSDLDGPHDGGLAPPPQLLLPDVSGRALAPLSLFVGPASPHVVAASPLTAAAPAAQGAVGLEEKVDWLHRGQVESAQSEAHFGNPDMAPTFASYDGSAAGLQQFAATRVSVPSSLRPSSAGAAPACASHTGGDTAHAAESDDEPQASASSSSSDFSYGSSSGDEDVDGAAREERRTIRAARKALQRARRSAGLERLQQRLRDQQAISAQMGAQAAISTDDPQQQLAAQTCNDWERLDARLDSAQCAQRPLPAVHTAAGAEPAWAADRAASLKAANVHLRAHNGAAGIDMPSLLPPGVALPASTPAQGAQSVAEQMRLVGNAAEPEAHACASQRARAADGVQWQLHDLAAEHLSTAPVAVMLRRVVHDVVLQSSLRAQRHLMRFMLGTCDLAAELQRVRGIMFLAHPAMREWAHGVATRLSSGLSLADPSTHGQVALAQLQVDLETRLRAAGVFQRSEDDTWVVQVLHRKRAQAQHGLLGQPLVSSKAPRAAVSQIAHIDVVYNVAWPLNVVITEAHMQRCRQMLSVFLQMHWVHGQLSAASRLMWATKRSQLRLRATSQPANLPPPHRPEGPGLTPTAAGVALKHMHHVMGALRQTMLLDALHTAGAALDAALADAAAAVAVGDVAPNGGCASVDELLLLHSAHLDAVERALWLSRERSAQVIARKIYELLDLALGFCAAASRALAPPAGGDAGDRSAQARRRAAGSKAAQLARAFQDAAADLVAVLDSKEIQHAAGPQAARLLETLNFNKFYSKDQ